MAVNKWRSWLTSHCRVDKLGARTRRIKGLAYKGALSTPHSYELTSTTPVTLDLITVASNPSIKASRSRENMFSILFSVGALATQCLAASISTTAQTVNVGALPIKHRKQTI